MRFVILFVLLSICSMTLSFGNELFSSDTLSSNKDELPTLLKSNDYSAKTKFLNSFYSPAYLGGLKSYSEDIQLDSIVINEWSEELNRIEKLLLYTCKFEDEGKTVLVDIKNWDSLKSKWINGSHNYYWFNEQGKLNEVEFQDYVSPEYRLYTKIIYEYENGFLKYESKYDRIDEIEVWDEIEQLEYKYYDNNLLETVYTKEWDPYEVAWLSNAYRSFKYDSTDVLKTEIQFDYNYIQNTSIRKFELRYDYDSLGNIEEVIKYIPGWEEGPFVAERKQTNTYDESAKLESESYYNYDYDSDGWNGEVRWVYNNVADGTILWEVNNYLWDTEKSKWKNNYKSEFTSEKRFVTSDIKDWIFLETYLPVYAFDELVCDRIETQNTRNDSRETIGFTNYHFSKDDLVGVNDRHEISVNVYPNPVVDLLNLVTKDFDETVFTLYDLSGRMIEQKQFTSAIQVNISGFQPGVYILELKQTGHSIYKEKIVKY